jgi:hypothetical protein
MKIAISKESIALRYRVKGKGDAGQPDIRSILD